MRPIPATKFPRRNGRAHSALSFNNGANTDEDIADVFTQRITTPFHIYRNVFIPNGCTISLAISSPTGPGKIDGLLTASSNVSAAITEELSMSFVYAPTIGRLRSFSLSASETWDRFRLPLTNGDFSVLLASLQGNYSFTRFLTFTSLIQVDTSHVQAVSANVQLRYNYRPDSDVYIIYNVGTQFASIAPANPPQIR